MLYRAQGQYGEAERLYLRALKIQERGIFKAFARTSRRQSGLPIKARTYSEANTSNRSALDGQERHFGKDITHSHER